MHINCRVVQYSESDLHHECQRDITGEKAGYDDSPEASIAICNIIDTDVVSRVNARSEGVAGKGQ